jgi:hypothetical protein
MIEIILSVIAILISIVSLIATLRKKEFGQFLFVQKENDFEIWIRVVKSNIYDVRFDFVNDIKPNRIKILYPNEIKDIPLWFESSNLNELKLPVISDDSILKITNSDGLEIKIYFRDRFNNHYCQILDKSKISNRKHLNCLNLTFGDS